jgi:hypothetical protein
MSNMSHCRFTNTLEDLRDCADYIDANDLSESETKARARLIKVCREIVRDAGGE